MDELSIKINKEGLLKLLKSHISIYYGQTIDGELIEQICAYTVNSLEDFFNYKQHKGEENG